MAKKLGSFRILSYTLSVLATVVFIVACGDGVPDILLDFAQDLGVSENYMNDKIEDVMEQQPEPPPPPPPLSSNVGGEESSDSGSGDKSSSSNWEQPSSTSPGVSSEAAASSSAGESLYTLECNIINSTFPSGIKKIEIKDRPEVKCKVKATGAVITLDENTDFFYWSNDPPWNPPAVGTYNDIRIRIDRAYDGTRECQGMEVKCNGTITITGTVTPSSSSRPPTPSSNSTPSSSSRPSSSSVASSSSRASSSSANNSGTCGSTGTMCLWDAAGGCWKIKDQAERENCAKNGWIFDGGDEGATTACKGGTFICGKDNNPPKGGATSLGCCRWDDGKNQCWNIYSDTDVTNCKSGNNKFWNQKCPDTNGTCPNN